MYEYEVSFASYAKLYNQTLILFKKAKSEFNKLKDGTFNKEKFEELKKDLLSISSDLSMCHHELTAPDVTFTKEESAILLKFDQLNQAVNSILIDYQNYLKIMNHASVTFAAENAEEISIN